MAHYDSRLDIDYERMYWNYWRLLEHFIVYEQIKNENFLNNRVYFLSDLVFNLLVNSKES